MMNQEKLCRYLLPGEKIVKLPRGLPSFPVETQDELNNMENFLEDDSNLSAAVSSNLSYIYINSISVIEPFMSNLHNCLLVKKHCGQWRITSRGKKNQI